MFAFGPPIKLIYSLYCLSILLKKPPAAGDHLTALSAVGQISIAALSGTAVISTIQPVVFIIPAL